jgi:alpha-L-rhamnosidase
MKNYRLEWRFFIMAVLSTWVTCFLSGSFVNVMAAPNAPFRLTCENVANPLGIDNPTPIFGWAGGHSDRGQAQTGYQIIVASSKANIDLNTGDIWSKQDVASSQQTSVQYAGPALKSKTKYWWKVCVWDKSSAASPRSDAATFETAMLNAADWEGAQWVGGDFGRMRKEFTVDNTKTIAQARAYVSGQGYYELRINGQKVGDHVLDPGFTDYVFRALYSTYDITSLVKPGVNAAGIMLGNAYLIQWELEQPSDKKALLQIEIRYTDNSTTTIVTDATWKGIQTSPVLSNGVYAGEKYDARLEDAWDKSGYTETGWSAATTKTAPTIVAAQVQAIKVVDTLKPVSLNGGVFDFGQNIAGWTRLTASGSAGNNVTLNYCELTPGTGGTEVSDGYTLRGSGTESWEPRFTYHGFQYVKVSGVSGLTTSNVTCCVVRSDVDTIGDFSCSSILLNKIHNAYVWTQKDNLCSVPTGCCQRDERKGWMADAMVTSEAACFNLGMKAFYAKWFNDMEDFQKYRAVDFSGAAAYGAIANINPCPEAERSPANWAIQDIPWSSAAISIPWDVYMAYGDTTLLEKHYQMMRKFVEYIKSISVGYLCSSNRWGDWAGAATDGTMLSTGYYFRCAYLLSKIAQELGKTADAATYSQLSDSIKTVFNANYLKNNDHYNNNEQVANALALYFGIVPAANKAAVLAGLTKNIADNGNHLTTGVVGTHCLMNALWQNGAIEAGYALANQTTQPSWGYMIGRGATTIWEFWNGSQSWNHPMLGGPIDAWFYKAVLGIYPTKPGYEELAIRPQIGGGLTNAQGSVMTVRGLVSSGWQLLGANLILNVTVPFNSRAVVSVPKPSTGQTTIYEGATLVWQGTALLAKTAGIDSAREDTTYVNFSVGSGIYRFGYTPGTATAIGIKPAVFKGLRFLCSGRNARLFFDLDKGNFVNTAIMDMQGRSAAGIRQGYYQPGPHEIVFNFNSLAAGSYIYRVTVGKAEKNRSTVGKFVVTK